MKGSKTNPAITEETRAEIERTAEALYGGSLRDFANDRKRLATELRQAGNRAAATAVASLARPTLSAWLINRLWRNARPEFDALFGAAARIRAGELGAVPEQRAALTRLRNLAADVLRADGHAAADGTLARTSTTLQALAAAGSFDPDPPGRLLADRDPPGFESMAGLPLAGPAAATLAPAVSAISAPASVESVAQSASTSTPESSGRTHTQPADREGAAATRATTQSDAAERVATERTAAVRTATVRTATERTAAERTAAERTATERAAAERTATERAAAERAVAERAATERAATERAVAERAATERAAAERAAAQRAAAERKRALERQRVTVELTNLERLAEQARRNEQARSKTAEDLRAALKRAESALAEAQARAETAASTAAEARARLEALTREPDPDS